MKEFKLKASGDKIIIKPDVAKDVSDGGLILPETAKPMLNTGVVVSVGKDIPDYITVGSKIMHGNGHFQVITINHTDYFVMRIHDMIGVFAD